MRLILQRTTRASVVINGGERREIGPGLVILLGVTHADTSQITGFMAKKAAELRIFSDEAGAMNRSLLEVGGEALVIPNFTLYASCRKGRRPSFVRAGAPKGADALYRHFLECLRKTGVSGVRSGEFGADMKVELVNDGPVTILLDSDEIMPQGAGTNGSQ